MSGIILNEQIFLFLTLVYHTLSLFSLGLQSLLNKVKLFIEAQIFDFFLFLVSLINQNCCHTLFKIICISEVIKKSLKRSKLLRSKIVN